MGKYVLGLTLALILIFSVIASGCIGGSNIK